MTSNNSKCITPWDAQLRAITPWSNPASCYQTLPDASSGGEHSTIDAYGSCQHLVRYEPEETHSPHKQGWSCLELIEILGKSQQFKGLVYFGNLLIIPNIIDVRKCFARWCVSYYLNNKFLCTFIHETFEITWNYFNVRLYLDLCQVRLKISNVISFLIEKYFVSSFFSFLRRTSARILMNIQEILQIFPDNNLSQSPPLCTRARRTIRRAFTGKHDNFVLVFPSRSADIIMFSQ